MPMTSNMEHGAQLDRAVHLPYSWEHTVNNLTEVGEVLSSINAHWRKSGTGVLHCG